MKVKVSPKNNTQVKYRYSKTVLKYSTQVNLLCYCPPLIILLCVCVCVCVRACVYYMYDKTYCKLLSCTQKNENPQAFHYFIFHFHLYCQCVVGALCAFFKSLKSYVVFSWFGVRFCGFAKIAYSFKDSA